MFFRKNIFFRRGQFFNLLYLNNFKMSLYFFLIKNLNKIERRNYSENGSGMIINYMEFTAVTNIFIRHLNYNSLQDFQKEIDNSQILMFKSVDELNTIYKLEQNQIHISVSTNLINIINNSANNYSIKLFESNFIFEYYVYISDNHFISWEFIKNTKFLKNYNVICFLITYEDVIIKHSIHSNLKLENFYLIDKLIQDSISLNSLKIHIYLNEDITIVDESYSFNAISVAPNSFFLYPSLVKIGGPHRIVRRFLVGSNFLYFKQTNDFFWELEKITYYPPLEEDLIDDYLIFETNLFFEIVIHLGSHFTDNFIEEFFEEHFLDKYTIHSFIVIDPLTNVLTDFNHYGPKIHVLDNSNYKLFVDTMTYAGHYYYLFLNRK